MLFFSMEAILNYKLKWDLVFIPCNALAKYICKFVCRFPYLQGAGPQGPGPEARVKATVSPLG